MNVNALSGSRVVLLLCGSFNPPTILHLRMFERARDFFQQVCHCQVLEGILSPVSDYFSTKKPTLVASDHRLKMAHMASESSGWIRADDWECNQKRWSRTVEVLRHHRSELRKKYSDDRLRLVLLCGGDTVDSFTREDPSNPGSRLWCPEHLEEIVSQFGLCVIQRVGSHPYKVLRSQELNFLHKVLYNTAIIEDATFPNELSSTRLRDAVRQGQSIRYCTTDSVVEYIQSRGLYRENDKNDATANGVNPKG